MTNILTMKYCHSIIKLESKQKMFYLKIGIDSLIKRIRHEHTKSVKYEKDRYEIRIKKIDISEIRYGNLETWKRSLRPYLRHFRWNVLAPIQH